MYFLISCKSTISLWLNFPGQMGRSVANCGNISCRETQWYIPMAEFLGANGAERGELRQYFNHRNTMISPWPNFLGQMWQSVANCGNISCKETQWYMPMAEFLEANAAEHSKLWHCLNYRNAMISPWLNFLGQMGRSVANCDNVSYREVNDISSWLFFSGQMGQSVANCGNISYVENHKHRYILMAVFLGANGAKRGDLWQYFM